MGFMFTKVFWGIFFIGWGITLILNKIFELHLPFFRFFIAFTLIYCGIYLIGKYNRKQKPFFNWRAFSNITINVSDGEYDYNSIFSSNTIDLTSISSTTQPLTINTIFGETNLYLSNRVTYDIRVNTVFGSTQFPTDREINFGADRVTLGDEENEKRVKLEISTVFGLTNIMIREVVE